MLFLNTDFHFVFFAIFQSREEVICILENTFQRRKNASEQLNACNANSKEALNKIKEQIIAAASNQQLPDSNAAGNNNNAASALAVNVNSKKRKKDDDALEQHEQEEDGGERDNMDVEDGVQQLQQEQQRTSKKQKRDELGCDAIELSPEIIGFFQTVKESITK